MDNETTSKTCIHKKRPLSTLTKEELIDEVKRNRIEVRNLKREIARLQATEQDGIPLNQDIADGLAQVTEGDSEFISLFQEEQRKARSQKNLRGMRWNPMMIRYAIFLQLNSPRAYEMLKESGVLILPNSRTLRDYTNAMKKEQGVQEHLLKKMERELTDKEDTEKYFVLVFDEMQVKEDLVVDSATGELVGFVHPEAWNWNKVPDSSQQLATHVLAVMLRGINNHLKYVVAFWATNGAKSGTIYNLIWETIAKSELHSIKVIVAVADKASPNQAFFRMHAESIHPVVYKVRNIYALEGKRDLYFMTDPSHLIKTIRNCLESSRPNGTRYLWVDGQNMSWNQILTMYNMEKKDELSSPAMLTDQHLYLDSASKMSTKLAVQVMSRTVGLLLEKMGDHNKSISEFIKKVDRLFDILNVRSMYEARNCINPDLEPFRHEDDERFQFLEDFIKYLDDWESQVRDRRMPNGDRYNRDQQNRMMLSKQSIDGCKTTILGFIECVRYLLSRGVPYVLSQVFSQDDLEETFGRHRGMDRSSTDPSMMKFMDQSRKIELSRDLSQLYTPKGSTKGKKKATSTLRYKSALQEPLVKKQKL